MEAKESRVTYRLVQSRSIPAENNTQTSQVLRKDVPARLLLWLQKKSLNSYLAFFLLQISIYSNQDLLHFLDLKAHVSDSYEEKGENYLCELLAFPCCSSSSFSPIFLLFLHSAFFIRVKICLTQDSWLWM